MRHTIINIGRSLGSGGYVIAKNIAEHYSFDFYDKELLNLAAQESGLSKECFENVDEQQRHGFGSFLMSSFSIFGVRNTHLENPLSQESLFVIQSKTIKRLASERSCVFVGRCADYILRDMPECINIFCYAPLDFRIKTVSQRQSITEDEARKLISKVDASRAEYYNYFTNKTWKGAESYHLLIDTSVFGLERSAEYLCQYIDKVIEQREQK